MSFLDQTLRGTKKYNPNAYVPGGSTKKKAKAIQSKGKMFPVAKPKKPRAPVAGSNSGQSTSLTNALGAQAQQTDIQRRQPTTQMTVSYESDPVLARIRALATQNVGNAETEAAAIRKQAVIDTGLSDVGREIGLDESTLGAAAANPFSAIANLRRDSTRRGLDLDESLNQQNLFWSGHRANQLGDLARNTAEAEVGLGRDLRSILGQADLGVLQARAQAAAEEQAALEAVAERERQAAYLNALLNPPVINDTGYPENTSYADLGVVPDPITGPDPYAITGPSVGPYGGNLFANVKPPSEDELLRMLLGG